MDSNRLGGMLWNNNENLYNLNSDNDEPEHISGIELLNNCHALKSSSSSITKTIWLWPGWLSNCSKADAIDNGNFQKDAIILQF